MTMQILATLFLLVWAGVTAVMLGSITHKQGSAISFFFNFALSLAVTTIIFVVTGALLVLATIATGVQVWAL